MSQSESLPLVECEQCAKVIGALRHRHAVTEFMPAGEPVYTGIVLASVRVERGGTHYFCTYECSKLWCAQRDAERAKALDI